MKAGIKRDLVFACSSIVGLAVYVATGFALGKVKYGHVADMILTNWNMTGLGVFFVLAIIYAGFSGAADRMAKSTDASSSGRGANLSGKTVAIVACLFLVLIVAVVAYNIFRDD